MDPASVFALLHREAGGGGLSGSSKLTDSDLLVSEETDKAAATGGVDERADQAGAASTRGI